MIVFILVLGIFVTLLQGQVTGAPTLQDVCYYDSVCVNNTPLSCEGGCTPPIACGVCAVGNPQFIPCLFTKCMQDTVPHACVVFNCSNPAVICPGPVADECNATTLIPATRIPTTAPVAPLYCVVDGACLGVLPTDPMNRLIACTSICPSPLCTYCNQSLIISLNTQCVLTTGPGGVGIAYNITYDCSSSVFNPPYSFNCSNPTCIPPGFLTLAPTNAPTVAPVLRRFCVIDGACLGPLPTPNNNVVTCRSFCPSPICTYCAQSVLTDPILQCISLPADQANNISYATTYDCTGSILSSNTYTCVQPTCIPPQLLVGSPFVPTIAPTIQPSVPPTVVPTISPTSRPTNTPSRAPSFGPTRVPTTTRPTRSPTQVPSRHPTRQPTSLSTALPTAFSQPTISDTPVISVIFVFLGLVLLIFLAVFLYVFCYKPPRKARQC